MGNKTANRITKFSKNSQQNNSETVTNDFCYKWLIIDDLRLKQ